MMRFLPLVIRELRVATRRGTARRVRMAIAGGTMCLSYWALLAWGIWQSGAALGHAILNALAFSGFIAGAVSGILLTADCLSSEKREETLGLLFLTDLQPRDVVLGKFAGKAIVPFYAGLAIVPALAICVIVGGVTGGEFVRVGLVLINTLFFSLAASLLTSAATESQRIAYGAAFLGAVLFFGIFPGAGALLSLIAKNPIWAHICQVVSPMGNYLLSFDKPYQLAAGWFWASLGTTHLLGWLCLFLACRILPHRWRHQELESRFGLSQLLATKRLRARLAPEPELLASHPVAWLNQRQNGRNSSIWCLPIVACGLLLGSAVDPFGNRPSQIGFAVLVGIHAAFTLWLAADATYAFAADRRSGALELLLGTPLPIHEIATGMCSAFRHRFMAPFLALMTVDLLFVVRSLATSNTPAAIWTLLVAIALVTDAYCLSWVGLWQGLVSRHPALAMLATVGRIIALPWILFGAAAVVFVQSSPTELAFLWLIIGRIATAISLSHAKNGLLQHFRLVALRPFGGKPPHIESQWSAMNWEPSDLESVRD